MLDNSKATEFLRYSTCFDFVINLLKFILSYLGGIAAKPRPATTDRWSIDLIDLADIFTNNTRISVENNQKVSTETDLWFRSYGSCK